MNGEINNEPSTWVYLLNENVTDKGFLYLPKMRGILNKKKDVSRLYVSFDCP